jgi:hypothetical protein
MPTRRFLERGRTPKSSNEAALPNQWPLPKRSGGKALRIIYRTRREEARPKGRKSDVLSKAFARLDVRTCVCHTQRMTGGHRINARLTPLVAGKVAALRRRTGKSTTEVIVAALDRYHSELEKGGGTPASIMEQNGFIASASASKNLSRRYKTELATSLRKKR